jgi:hypothetical protein
MQMGVEERQDIASGRYPAPPTVMDAASRALHMHDLMTPRTKYNLVVEETMICCGNNQASNPMTTPHSGMDMAEMTGIHCGSVGHLKLGTDRVSVYWLNGNSAELPFQKAGYL